MIEPHPSRRHRLIARLAAAAFAAVAGYCLVGLASEWLRVRSGSDAMMLIFSTPVLVGLTALFAWPARLLWAGPTPRGIRVAVGVAVPTLLFLLVAEVVSPIAGGTWEVRWVTDVAACLAVIVSGVAYVWLTRRLILAAGLADPPDPVGHAGRVRMYAVVLGFATWLAAGSVAWAAEHDTRPGLSPWIEIAALVVPIALGWGAYRLTLARLAPTDLALPPGGFEVIRQNASNEITGGDTVRPAESIANPVGNAHPTRRRFS